MDRAGANVQDSASRSSVAGASIAGAEERRWIECAARNAGFDLAGMAEVPAPESAGAQAEKERFAHWVAAGYAGEMEWLKRAGEDGGLLRGDLRRPMPWARSVVVCALNYNAGAPRSIDPAPATAGWIARYAWSGQTAAAMQPSGPDAALADAAPAHGADYHDVLLNKLNCVEAEIRARFAGCQTRCYVDTGPILERGYAARAGVGWIGKNTCVLNQQLGSWLLLGVIVTSLELAPQATVTAAADRCGTCTRCIDACPTEALLRPTAEQPARQMDASRCIAYLTIEKKGAIDDDLRAKMGRHVFGCDICQDVCPWNRRAPLAQTAALPARHALVNPDLEWLAAMDSAAFNRWFRGSPLERTRRRRVLRNVAIAMGNSGEPRFLERLAAWAVGEDDVLADAARGAIEKLRTGSGGPGNHPTDGGER